MAEDDIARLLQKAEFEEILPGNAMWMVLMWTNKEYFQ
jgi:hypothetical protein